MIPTATDIAEDLKLRFFFTPNGFELDERGDTEYLADPGEWRARFRSDPWEALYDFGFGERPKNTDSAGLFLYDVADAFLSALTDTPDLELARERLRLEPDAHETRRLLDMIPFALGSHNVTEEWIKSSFARLNEVFAQEIASENDSVAMYLAGKSQHLHVKERLFFHLVEARDKDLMEYPFAFLTTYSTRGEGGRIRHVPLRYALTEYKNDRGKLLELLGCLNRVSEKSSIIAEFVDNGELFYPLQLTSEEAYRILRDVPAIEECGVVCRIPNWWRRNTQYPQMTVQVGKKKPSLLGMDSILATSAAITVDGVELSEAEIQDLLEQSEGLAYIKGKWIEVNHERLRRLLDRVDGWSGDLTLLRAVQMGSGQQAVPEDEDTVVVHGEWLSGLLRRMRNPESMRDVPPPGSLRAVLRPYQQVGYSWLQYMGGFGFGACLADDMGLGKTVQVLAYLEKLRLEKPDARILLVVPASLVSNWEKEAAKFAPDMPVTILHGRPASELAAVVKSRRNSFLTITTYGMTIRIPELEKVHWDAIILDEAQAIKNPATKQSRQIRKFDSDMRIALTGTPVENELINLWSIFDFLNRGLLGSRDDFLQFTKGLDTRPEGYAQLKNMIAPFMLRRMKTDRNIITDLPDKLEMLDYVPLSSKQHVLYKDVVRNAEREIEAADTPFTRGAVVLKALMKLKQVCNHPDQYLGQSAFTPSQSGKFEVMRDICRNIAENRERVLVFTQFREITDPLDEFLQEVFGCRGFVLHGGTPVRKRGEIVDAFQSDRYYPYVILSVKAGGTGLNLTNANHVIHFDRWWNPAVEDQATDRAFRIGQKKDVMVHKLVTKGTIEEKIDALINSKKELARNVVGTGESWIGDLSNDELFSLMQLS